MIGSLRNGATSEQPNQRNAVIHIFHIYILTCSELMGLPDTKNLLLKSLFWCEVYQIEPDKVIVINRPS